VKRFRKWLKRLGIAMAALVVAAWAFHWWVFHHCVAEPPPLPEKVPLFSARPEFRGGRWWLGKSWAGEREGLPVVYLAGSHLEMGYASGVLLSNRVHTLENEFIDMVRGYVPEQWKIDVLHTLVLFRNRNLSDQVPLRFRQQIHGLTLGCPDIHPELGNYYNRFLNYHAAHDVSYMMIDNPLVSKAGCTSFGAWGGATENGHLLTGRNFDWEAAEVFSRDRVVILAEPDGAIPFVSLAWAGMAGVVSGMNRAGVSITLNGAPSSLPGETATPVALVARDVLERARNLDEALKILRAARVYVSTLLLVGSRADGRFVVVEKTPDATDVREPSGDSITCANHFTAAGKDSKRNQDYLADSTSVSRQKRGDELVREARGKLNAARTAEILRDRRLPGGAFPGHGHRGTLNALIATHATIMDLSDGIFWAAAPPNQLGRFVAFDVNDFTRERPDRAVPADPALASGDHATVRKALQFLADGHRALTRKDAAAALELADKAEKLNPGFYQNAALRGRALLMLGRAGEAAESLRAAIDRQPAFLGEKAELEKLLGRARGD
jgi:tetratricopeptide (TPR) repeat protein